MLASEGAAGGLRNGMVYDLQGSVWEVEPP